MTPERFRNLADIIRRGQRVDQSVLASALMDAARQIERMK